MADKLMRLELKRAKRSNDPWADEELVLVADGRTVATSSNLANEALLRAIVEACNRVPGGIQPPDCY